ncbi:MAG TPA: hypothetical protein VM098_04015, partial [Phycisphaerae bacterium]|nr:hypothetical protein [Phycisphaerae bacterium]
GENRWSLTVIWEWEDEPVSFEGVDLKIRLCDANKPMPEPRKQYGVNLFTDEAGARRWAAFPKNTPVVAKGGVRRIVLNLESKEAMLMVGWITVDRPTPEPVKKAERALKVAPATRPAPPDPAAGKLLVAKAYIKSGMATHARAVLAEIIENYPESKEAEEAKQLLEKLRPE